ILAARDCGLRVPHDLSVVGIDDHELANFFGLTTVAQFPAEQGRIAVEILMEQLHPTSGGAGSLDTPLDYRLIVRSSTAANTSAAR
ncbi:MAG TPA: substrate-binding domain-containing protein, partial [Glaciihabitans sp.]|nr:substrate-binding domain-containing protein [Glaciihabitans sp.]